MEQTEMESLVRQLKGAGLTEEQIMDTFYETFKGGEMDKEDLKSMAEFMGYELTPEFESDGHAQPIDGGEGNAPAEGITKEEAEKAKENPPAPEAPTDEDAEWEEAQKKLHW